MNTKPPSDDKTRIVWTAKDEALLKELEERRRRVYDQNFERLCRAVNGIYSSSVNDDDIAKGLIETAAQVIAALQPFVATSE